jgi:transposase InsO family protein
VLSEHGVKIAPNTYWVARKRLPSARAVRDEQLKIHIGRVWAENLFVYGAAKVWAQLNNEGIRVARCTVERLMGDMGLSGARRGRAWRSTTDSGHPYDRPSDLVDRRFAAPAPNRLWVADIERHEALPNPAVMKGHRHRLVAASRLKLRAAQSLRRGGGRTAALTTTGRASTARWSGPASETERRT